MKIMKSRTFNFQFEIEETLQLSSDLQYNLENEPSIDFEHYSTYARNDGKYDKVYFYP